MQLQNQETMRKKVVFFSKLEYLFQFWFLVQVIISLYLLLNQSIYSSPELGIRTLLNGFIAILGILILVISGVVFVTWYYRSYKNLEIAGIKKEYSNKLVVIAYLIPVVNLYYPFKIMRELFFKMKEYIGQPTANLPYIITLWWALFVGNIMITKFSWGLPMTTPKEILFSAYMDGISIIIEILYIYVFLKMFALLSQLESDFLIKYQNSIKNTESI